MSTVTDPSFAPERAAVTAGVKRGPRTGWLVLCIAAASFCLTVGAARRTSTTFDEIVMIASGARGYHTGHWGLLSDQPPVMQYAYGLPVALGRPHYPSEGPWTPKYVYNYAQAFFWGSGNNPQRLAFLARLVDALVAAGLIFAVWAFARRAAGDGAALLAALLVAFLPDVLGHGGVAYNDVPTTLAFFLAIWAIDSAVRDPGVARGVLAGALAALAVGIKFSAVVLAPVALLLIIVEATARAREDRWRRGIWLALDGALLAGYLALVAIYRGDWALNALQEGVHFKIYQAAAGFSSGPAYFLGRQKASGFWYFYPVAFLLKTPVTLPLLMAGAAIGFAARLRERPSLRRVLASRLRAPLLGLLAYGAVLFRAQLDIGFRHAMPVLPMLCVLTAAGVVELWRRYGRVVRVLIVLALGWYVGSAVSRYPDFLAYVSAFGGGRPAYRLLDDSSLDWGQGLLQLHDFIRREGGGPVYLSYFGSAWPAGYGIHYVPLPSFYPLPQDSTVGALARPRFVVISATSLVGNYLKGDPFAAYRELQPYRVVGGVLYVYRTSDVERALGRVMPSGGG